MDLVICEIFNKKIHGFDDNNDPTVLGHYMVAYNFTKVYSDTEDDDTEDDTDDEENDDNTDTTINLNTSSVFINTKIILKMYKGKYNNLNNSMKNHSIIRNYKQIITQQNYIQLHIAKVIYLSGSECVAIIKTFWLKIIQRTWKNVYKQRCNIIALRKLPSSQFYRERHGKWPDNCYNLPSLYGLLSS